MAKKTTKGAPEAQDTKPTTWTEIAPTATTEPGPRKKRAKAEAAAEPQAQRTPPTDPDAKPAKKAKRTKDSATLETVFAGYLEGLKKGGKSDGTIASYRMELQLAGDDLGLDTSIADLKPERVLLFFGSARVTKKRNGKVKSPLSIDKTRRVLRQALQWAETAKLVAKAPVPELAASH